MRRKLLLAAVSLGLITLSAGAGQAAKGTINVLVTDGSGTPVEGVTVKLERSALQASGGNGGAGIPGNVRSAWTPDRLDLTAPMILVSSKPTDKDGKVSFTGMKNGKYRVSVSGAKGRALSPVSLSDDKGVDITLKLQPNG